MSHEPKPSEHAINTAKKLFGLAGGALVQSCAEVIDLHAIAPAVAERDRRIAEMDAALARIQGFTMSQFVSASDAFQKCREIAAVAIAKSERSAP